MNQYWNFVESQQHVKYWNCSVAALVVGAWYRQAINCHGACDATSRICFAATCRLRLLSSREVFENGCICRALPIMSLSVTCLIVAAVCISRDCGNVVADYGVEMPSLFWFVHVAPSASVVCCWSLWFFTAENLRFQLLSIASSAYWWIALRHTVAVAAGSPTFRVKRYLTRLFSGVALCWAGCLRRKLWG